MRRIFAIAAAAAMALGQGAIAQPTDGARNSQNGTAIPVSAPHPNAAQLFVNFLLSVEASKLQVSNGLPPLRPEVEPMAGSLPLDEIKMAILTDEEIVNGVPPIIERWRDIFGG